MIVKKVKYTDQKKSKVWQIGDLVDYIRNPHKTNAHEKIAHAGSRNFLSGTHTGQKLEMILLAEESAHSKMPVSHWVFSWKETEQPSRAQVDELVDIFLAHMGLTEHQTVYGLHYNTKNYHVHIAVNRMHPGTLKVAQPFKGFDIEEGHKIVAKVECKQGWASEAHTRYVVLENGELARNRTQKPPQPRQEALAVERATGEKSAQRIAQERGYDILKNALSWLELHQKLAEQSLRFEKKGSGAILFVGDIAVKASSVDRAFSMSKLCQRLGEFVPAPETDTAPPALPPEPVSAVNLEEWREYQAERTAAPSPQTGLRPPKPRRRPQFETWLRKRGLHLQADRWRHRRHFEPVVSQPSVQERIMPQPTQESQQCEQYIAAVNAERLRVTCLRLDKDGSRKAFILDKQGGMSKGFTPDEVQARIPEMLRLQQRGENIYYTPLSTNRHHILIDDMTRESLEKLHEDGFRPAVVLESSPNNYQCVLTIPKRRGVHDRDVGNRLTERLNKQYGDPKLSGCIHPHRAPGFGNFKPKHRKADGSYPRVKLLQAEKRECAKALELARRIEREYADAVKAQRQTQPPRPTPTALRPGDSTTAYYAHFDNIRKHLTVEDLSRVDAMIALRLRANGHSPQAVADAIHQCAPTIREKREGRDWQRYAERTAAYAFGVAGDVALATNERFVEHWRKIEGIQEVLQEVQRVRMR